MTETKFYAHEGHFIVAEHTEYESLVAYEGVPRQGWSGGRSFVTSDRVIEQLVIDQNAEWDASDPNAVRLHFEPGRGVLVELAQGDVNIMMREPESGLMETPGWTWGEIEDIAKVKRVVYMQSDEERALAQVTDLDRLAYLRRRLEFWISNVDANIQHHEAVGTSEDIIQRMRLDRAVYDDILGRIDGREDTYIASLKREGTL